MKARTEGRAAARDAVRRNADIFAGFIDLGGFVGRVSGMRDEVGGVSGLAVV